MEFNVVYLATVGRNFGGVEQKIIAQYDELSKLKPAAVLYLVCSKNPQGTFAKEINKRPGVKVLANSATNIRNPFYRRREKFQLISKALKNHDPENTIIYFRFPNSDFEMLKFLKENRKFRVVTEHQEKEVNFREYNVVNHILENFYGRRVRRRLSAIVGVTPEITKFEIEESGQRDKRNITLGNGVNVQKYPIRKLNPDHPEIIKILFVGSGYRCHGIDRIIKGIANYIHSGENKYNVLVRIAGEGNTMNANRTLAKKLRVEQNVGFLGHKNLEELNEHYNWADIAMGSLALHRIGLNFVSNLKAREYFTRGIPFFTSSVDEDLAGCAEYVMKVEADELPINIPDIINFTLRMRADTYHPRKMREYALANLDWSVKIKKLVGFFETLFD
jgi:glycosyltransferase involved in cell wall biosynthesis